MCRRTAERPVRLVGPCDRRRLSRMFVQGWLTRHDDFALHRGRAEHPGPGVSAIRVMPVRHRVNYRTARAALSTGDA